MAGQGASAADIRGRVTELSGYDLTPTVAEIRPCYRFDVSCDGSVPEAIICALEASSWEDAVRLAVSLGGDADTQAAIAGGIAGAWFGVGSKVLAEVRVRLDEALGEVLGRGGVGAGGMSHCMSNER